jgi:hypothetical protein
MKPEKLQLNQVFEYVEIDSTRLRRLLRCVVNIISTHVDFEEKGFGPLHEGHTPSGEAGEVTEDGIIYIDADKLKQYSDNVAKALIAHELAHHYLGHYANKNCRGTLDCEHEADDLARAWGFDIDEFRRVCGPPSLQQ